MRITKMTPGFSKRKINLVGFTGAGKTHQCRFLVEAGYKVLVVSTENKLLSLEGLDLDVNTMQTYEFPLLGSEWDEVGALIKAGQMDKLSDLVELCRFLKEGKHDYDVVFIDSGMQLASEMATWYTNRTLTAGGKVDTLRGYGEFAKRIDRFFDTVLKYTTPDNTPRPVHIVVTWGADWVDNGDGRKLLGPIVDGQKFTPKLPYKFSDIIYLYSEPDGDGNMARYAGLAQTDRWYAKVESGAIKLPPKVQNFNLATFLARLGGDDAKTVK